MSEKSDSSDGNVKKISNIAVFGAGSWGTALALLLAKNGHRVTVWSVDSDEIDMLSKHREHRSKLPGVMLPEEMEFTTDMKAAARNRDMWVMATPSVFVRGTAAKLKEFCPEGQVIVSVAKGLEESTLMRLSQVIEDELPMANVAVLLGPSHAEEVGKGLPTTIVAGARDRETAHFIQDTFMNDRFRVYTSHDMQGMELGAALKNVVALAAGIADGLGYGDNSKAALITRGIAEIGRVGVAAGGKLETFAGLTGIGDLIVTCASVHSRNRRAGVLIGQGKSYEEAMDEVKMVVEGVYSARAARKLAEKYGVEMPIVEEVNQILFEGKPAGQAVMDLMLREKKHEIEEEWD